jgi:hypothetical protein
MEVASIFLRLLYLLQLQQQLSILIYSRQLPRDPLGIEGGGEDLEADPLEIEGGGENLEADGLIGVCLLKCIFFILSFKFKLGGCL